MRFKTLFVAETNLPTRYGEFRLRGYRHKVYAKVFVLGIGFWKKH